MKPFDDKLADNIRKVFDEYHEPVDEKAWEAMQQRLGKKSGPRIIALFPYKVRAAAAVILLLVVSATVWFTFSPGEDEAKMAITTPQTHDTTLPDDSGHTEGAVFAEDTTSDQPDTQLAESITAREKEVFSFEYNGIDERKSHTPTVLLIAEKEEQHLEAKPARVLVAETEKVITEPDTETTLADIQPDIKKEPETDKPAINGIFPEIRYANAMLPKPRSRGSAMQFLAGSMVTYTTGEVADGVGFAAGVTGDFPLFENLSINTGGILVYNQFGFDDNSMFGVAMEALPNYYGSDDLMVIDETGYVDYEFMAVDFPLNLRMQILNDNRKQFYVSAGVSSFL
ncbi:MAG: hypothetical protein EA361_00925, partial [Bacteroidetes bacterium]